MNELLNNEDNRFQLATKFPKLSREGFTVTSPEDVRYNCIAFAAGDTSRCWWPDQMNQYYWDPAVPRVETLESFQQIFLRLGYNLCESEELEIGYEKIAIFIGQNGLPTHAARQTVKGIWLSKLGQGFDIEHVSLIGVSGVAYGKVAQIMKRKTPLVTV